MPQKNVADLEVGDQVQVIKTVTTFTKSPTSVTVEYDDDTSQTWLNVDTENPSVLVMGA